MGSSRLLLTQAEAEFSVGYAKEDPEAPEGGRAEKGHERYPGKASRRGRFALGLEHSKHSNDEQQDGPSSKNLQPHGSNLLNRTPACPAQAETGKNPTNILEPRPSLLL